MGLCCWVDIKNDMFLVSIVSEKAWTVRGYFSFITKRDVWFCSKKGEIRYLNNAYILVTAFWFNITNAVIVVFLTWCWSVRTIDRRPAVNQYFSSWKKQHQLNPRLCDSRLLARASSGTNQHNILGVKGLSISRTKFGVVSGLP